MCAPINASNKALHSSRNPFLSWFSSSFPAINFFMARFNYMVIILLVIYASLVPQMESRKLLNTGESNKNVASNLFASLVLSALPKGTLPGSAPNKKADATLDNEKQLASHLARIDRILQSVPSPGAGH
ncbi:hypothetical protein V6N13_143660 [Hibiscus sabdariffa]|uniref:Uncharacterized protein n=1 Tax=Hibiscus sabdariffa TaxID=183260 RepID=A0ABR2FIB4_9ROSI